MIGGGFFILLLCTLIYGGISILFGESRGITLMSREFLYFFILTNIMVIMTYSVQFTPFPVIDPLLLEFDKYSYLHLNFLMNWTHEHPRLQGLLNFAYASLDYQLFIIPLLMILMKRFEPLHEYYFLALTTMIIGFLFYYFFPTMAPASFIENPYFIESQKATGLKFQQIHEYIQPTTMEGGMISMPSFHVIWAYLLIYLLRGWSLLCWILLPLNLLIPISCILLGWHYPIDLLGSVIVIMLAHLFLKWSKSTK